MSTDFKIPDLGENIKSGTVAKILVKSGDTIKKDQPVVELETDKATLEVPSTFSGVIKEILIKAGAEVKVGQTILKYDPAGAGSSNEKTETKSEKKSAAPVASEPKQTASSATPKSEEKKSAPIPEAQTSTANVAAAPSVRRFAREIGIDIGQVPGSGPGGRISMEDVKTYSKSLNAGGRPSGTGGNVQSKSLPDFSKWGSIEVQPMSTIRKKTAEHLSYAWSTIPHVTQFGKADITELEKMRKRYSTKDHKLTITPFLLKVMAAALKNFPQFNASVNMANNEIIYKKFFNIGIAVDTDRGLLVPIIKNVDQKSIMDLSNELNEMAERARTKKTTLEELQGGSMTITNLGGIFGTFFTPIVNWPEVAILGVSRGGWEPVYENSQFIPRFMLPLSLSYDHRIIDGADGARFLKWVCEAIEQPFLMELEKR